MAPTSDDFRGHVVLILEDSFFIADDLRMLVEKIGASVAGPVPSVAEAVRILDSQQITAAVLDIRLQGEPGYDLVSRLIRDGIPFAFFTGLDEEAIDEQFRSAARWDELLGRKRLGCNLIALLQRAKPKEGELP